MRLDEVTGGSSCGATTSGGNGERQPREKWRFQGRHVAEVAAKQARVA